MKKIIIASGLLALMAAATSCDKYDIYPEDFDGIFTIRDAGTKDLVLYATDDATEVPFIVMKGGYNPDVVSKATLKVMNDQEFLAYNENLGTLPYILVGSECYSFSSQPGEDVYAVDYVFDSANKKAETTNLYVRPRQIKSWIENHADEIAVGDLTPVIPVTLTSETDTVNSYGNVTLLKVEVRVPEFTIDVSTVTTRTVNKQTFDPEGPNVYSPDANFSMPCDNPWGFKLNLVADPYAVEDYNDDHGTSYIPLPADKYTLQTMYDFTPGTTYMPLKLDIYLDELPIKKTYAVAVKLAPNAIEWYDAENNPGDALYVDKDMLMIFTIRVNDSVVLQKVNLSTANVTTNDQDTAEGPLANLFDGDVNTFFHSNWHAATGHDATYGSYLEITLPSAMANFRFDITARHNNNNGIPKKVCLFGTNDSANWPTTPFATISNMESQLTAAGASGSFGTDDTPYGDGKSYKYIRFCVMEAPGGILTSTSSNASWSAAELVLYGY